jgi:hypothetical protein
MKSFLAICFLLTNTKYSFAQSDTLIIKGTQFLTIKNSINNGLEQKDTVLRIYRREKGGEKYLFTFYLYRRGEDCNNSYDDIGQMKIVEDTVIFTTRYLQKGNDPIPESRKQVFVVRSDGKLILVDDEKTYKKSN